MEYRTIVPADYEAVRLFLSDAGWQHRVSFAGSTYRGIGVSHCVRQGAEAAQKISERIQHSPSD